jgi:lysozyme
LREFLAVLRATYGKEPVIYTTEEFRRHYLVGVETRRLWIREVVGLPPPEWLFWQFSSRGRVRGIATFVDLNAFSGERFELEALMGGPSTKSGVRAFQPRP